jgi:hypothetical protein
VQEELMMVWQLLENLDVQENCKDMDGYIKIQITKGTYVFIKNQNGGLTKGMTIQKVISRSIKWRHWRCRFSTEI